jgi:hypothetical protein
MVDRRFGVAAVCGTVTPLTLRSIFPIFDGLAKSPKTGFFLKITPVISTSYEGRFLVFRLFARPSSLLD